MTTLTLMVGVLVVMTTKPDGLASALTITAAVVVGVLSAIPFWRPSVTATAPPARELTRSEAE